MYVKLLVPNFSYQMLLMFHFKIFFLISMISKCHESPCLIHNTDTKLKAVINNSEWYTICSFKVMYKNTFFCIKELIFVIFSAYVKAIFGTLIKIFLYLQFQPLQFYSGIFQIFIIVSFEYNTCLQTYLYL